MKKIIVIVAAILITTSAFGQLNWGVKGGLNLTNVTKGDGNTKPSIYVGAFMEFYLIDDLLSIQPELLYSRQGAKADTDEGVGTVRMNYITLPVMFKLHVWNKLSIDLGPQFGYMLNAKAKVSGSDFVKVSDGFKDFDLSFGIGASYRVLSMLDVSFRYNLGLTKVMSISKSKNSVIQIGAGYRF